MLSRLSTLCLLSLSSCAAAQATGDAQAGAVNLSADMDPSNELSWDAVESIDIIADRTVMALEKKIDTSQRNTINSLWPYVVSLSGMYVLMAGHMILQYKTGRQMKKMICNGDD